MNLPTMKTSVLSRIRLRRGVPTVLALVATLALVSSAQAEVTYTWNGASATDDNWFLVNDIDPAIFDSENFSPTPVYSDIDNTDLVFVGTTRPNTILNSSYFGRVNFSARKLTFNTGANFSITPDSGQELLIGSGGIDNQVAFQQTINSRVSLYSTSGTTPVNVAGGGEIVINGILNNAFQVVEKTGSGTLTLNSFTQGPQDVLRSQAGTINLTAPNQSYGTNVEVNGGQVNLGQTSRLTGLGVSRVSGGVFSALGSVETSGSNTQAGLQMTSGTMIVGDKTYNTYGATISGGTVVYSGAAGGGASFDSAGASGARAMTITGGVQTFGTGTFSTQTAVYPSVLVTGGTSTGFNATQGLTNNGGSITFTAKTSAILDQAKNTAADLTFTSGTVSIGTVAGGATGIGALVNGSNLAPRNTTLGAGNTLKLDLNQAGLTKDLLITTGTMNWGGTLAFNLTNTGTLSDSASWNSFFFSNSIKTGAFTGDLIAITMSASSIYNGLNFSRVGVTDIWTSTAASTGQQFRFNESSGLLDIVPVPEPSSIVLAGLGLAMLGWRRLALRQRAAA